MIFRHASTWTFFHPGHCRGFPIADEFTDSERSIASAGTTVTTKSGLSRSVKIVSSLSALVMLQRRRKSPTPPNSNRLSDRAEIWVSGCPKIPMLTSAAVDETDVHVSPTWSPRLLLLYTGGAPLVLDVSCCSLYLFEAFNNAESPAETSITDKKTIDLILGSF